MTVAFPVLTRDFDTSLVVAGWVLNSYQLVATIMAPLAGKISDVVGRKPAFMVYTILFTAGSMASALAPNIYLLIGFRVLQGIGGGGFMPCAAGVVSEEFPEARQRYIGLFSSIFPIGMMIGPNLGGWMVDSFGWRSIFWLNVPIGIVILALSQWLLSTGKREQTGSSIDFTGAALLFGSLLTLMLGLTQIGNSSSDIPWLLVGGLTAAGIGTMVAFVWQEQRAREPIVDLELLKSRPFLAANIYNIIYGLTTLGTSSLLPLYAVSIYKMTIFESGVILTPRAVGTIVASVITSISIMNWGYRRPILIGTLIAAFSLFLLSLQIQGVEVVGFHIGATPLLLIILGLIGIGHGICTPASNNACIELMPEKVATITGLRGMFRQLGVVVSVAIGTVLLHNIGDVRRAFFIVLFGSALILLISIPLIFIMPRSPNIRPPGLTSPGVSS